MVAVGGVPPVALAEGDLPGPRGAMADIGGIVVVAGVDIRGSLEIKKIVDGRSLHIPTLDSGRNRGFFGSLPIGVVRQGVKLVEQLLTFLDVIFLRMDCLETANSFCSVKNLGTFFLNALILSSFKTYIKLERRIIGFKKSRPV